eukprot:CAMPEP_0116989134 /NCGR_PEP_ID=MMETSP0467-20121206/64612_1 /TAXON_ID=283647 /ORGANISM="Mesodinium pulex, Strain SPMC105" /LENGTH=87 /DNA_ID=CAMNT_0004685469 /DNA_START=1427 /DNA_END=1690 /DNA_ORIENTATION=+
MTTNTKDNESSSLKPQLSVLQRLRIEKEKKVDDTQIVENNLKLDKVDKKDKPSDELQSLLSDLKESITKCQFEGCKQKLLLTDFECK